MCGGSLVAGSLRNSETFWGRFTNQWKKMQSEIYFQGPLKGFLVNLLNGESSCYSILCWSTHTLGVF